MKKIWVLFMITLMAICISPVAAEELVTPEDWSAVGDNGNMGNQIVEGDFNGDTYPDIVVTAPLYDGGQGWGQGGVFVWMGSATGYGDPGTMANVDWYALGEVVSFEDDQLGYRAAVGNFNGDSYDDLAVSCVYCDEGYLREGAVYVYLGSSSGLGPNGTKDNADWKFSPQQASTYLGYGGLAVGNINGDSYDDLIVGVHLYDNGSTNEGMVFVWEGSASDLGDDGTPANADWVAEGEAVSMQLGAALAVGDLNDDGYDDLAVGGLNNGNGTVVYIWKGSIVGLGTNGTPANAYWQAQSDQTGSYIAQGMLAWGDFDGDTYDDLALGEYAYDDGETNEGAIFVWEGSDTGMGVDGTPANADWQASGEQAAAFLGKNISTGDFGGDGYDDLTATKDTANYGYVVAWYGSAGGLGPADGTPANADASLDTTSLFVGMADTNNDNYDDLLVGDPDYTEAGISGKIYVYLSDWMPPTNPTTVTETGGAQDEVWQNAVSDPAFTWSGASDDISGVEGYYVYFGDDAGGTSGTYIGTTAYDPPAVSAGEYYLRISTQDNAGNQSAWETVFTFRYDNVDPTNPSSASETSGAQDDVWQNGVNDPAFTWSGAADTHSGVAGYYVYFGSNPSGTSGTFTTDAAYDPGAVSDGTYYLRVSTRDNAGNQASWVTLFTLRYDGTNPTNPTTAAESGGAQDDTWQNTINDPNFTWSGADDAGSGVAGYFVYFGSNASGTSSNYVVSAAYNPTAVSSGTYYLRVNTLDNAGNQADWETIFTFRYDASLPTNPTAATETGGAQNDTWQNTINDPAFTWSGATDTPGGVAGYFVYFGDNPSGVDTTFVNDAAYDPATVSNGTYYLRVSTQDQAGNLADWVTLFTFRYQALWKIFLPLISYGVPPIPSMNESEPNNLFGEANLVDQLPIQIKGSHDGNTGTGDVFMLDDNLMIAGEVVQATIDTDSAAGLQLVVYDPQGQEIARAYDGEFVVSFMVPASGAYYVYVYTDPSAANTADYELYIEILP